MVERTPAGYLTLLKEQYQLLKDAVDDFYAGTEARAVDISVRIRTLVHASSSSTPLLSFLNPNYINLTIYHRAKRSDHPKSVFVLKQSVQLGGGTVKFLPPDFSGPSYELVPLGQWWNEEYLVIGTVNSSKKQVVLDLANKDGGAHVDEEIPVRHVVASYPPIRFGVNENMMQPNLARSTVAQAGAELQECIERNFPSVK